MKGNRTHILRGLPILGALLLGAFASPQFAGHAQTTAPIGTPISLCGPVTSFTAATASSSGLLTISNASSTQTFTLPAGTTLSGTPTITSGTNLCLIGTVNGAGQLTSLTLIPNSSSTVTLCGAVTAYSPATLNSLGSVTLGGQLVTLGLGATFTGTTLATGSNVCIAANVNSLGIVSGGIVTANTTSATGSTLVSVCGPISSYTAPTSSTTGSITISNVSINATYTLPAGTTSTGTLTLATGSIVCLVGVSNGSGQLSSATFTTNSPTQVFTCGKVAGYTAATTSAFGSLTVGTASIPLALGTTFAGPTVVTGTSQCFTLTINSLGQAVSGTVSTPLAAVLYIPDSAPTLAHRNLAMPL